MEKHLKETINKLFLEHSASIENKKVSKDYFGYQARSLIHTH